MEQKSVERQPHNELAEVIDRMIASFLATCEPRARDVADAVLTGHEDLVLSYGRLLADRQIRSMVADRMKKVTDANKQANGQFDLPFEIKGIPQAISFEVITEDEDTEIRYVALSRAKQQHLVSYEQLLRKQITADSNKLRAISQLRDILEPIFAEHPDISVAEACALLVEVTAL